MSPSTSCSLSRPSRNGAKITLLTVADSIFTNGCGVPLRRQESRLRSLLNRAGLAQCVRGGLCNIYYASLANRCTIFAVSISSRVVSFSSTISLRLVVYKGLIISDLMKQASIVVSAFVAFISVLLFQSQILGALNLASTRILTFYNSHTGLATSQLETTKATPVRDGKNTVSDDQLISDDMSIPRAIRKVFLAVEQAEGAGARVRRSVGTPHLRNFSPFLMLDHFSIKPGAGFPDQ